MSELDVALKEFRAACWRERWVFVALYASVMLVLLLIAGLAALGEPLAVGAWQFL